MELTEKQKRAVIILAFGLLVINGILVYKLINGDVKFDKSCPVPVQEVDRCDCIYNALGDKMLRYCICYPGMLQTKISDFLEVYDGTMGNIEGS